MTFIARLLRFLFWVAVVSWSLSLLRRLVGAMTAGGSAQNQDTGVPPNPLSQKLVRDPVCGMHIAPGLGLAVNDGGEMVQFCSPECRDKYLNGRRNRFAANA
jgi:YHS domain-containing protein